MQDNDDDDLEFTDEQLRAALKRVGEEVRKVAFAAGQPIIFAKGSSIVALYSDGHEEIIETLRRNMDAVSEPE